MLAAIMGRWLWVVVLCYLAVISSSDLVNGSGQPAEQVLATQTNTFDQKTNTTKGTSGGQVTEDQARRYIMRKVAYFAKKKVDCPAWMKHYTLKHQAMLQSPQEAKYLLYYCDEKLKHHCGGTGDRIRAMLDAVRLSYFSDRCVEPDGLT